MIKPVAEIQKIIEELTPFAQTFNASKGEVLRYYARNKRVCYLLHSGSVTLNHRENGLVINSEQAPLVLGVTNQLVIEDGCYLRVVENSVISRMTVERFNLVIESANLWKSFSNLMIYSTSRVYDHCTRAIHMSSRELILLQLQQLMKESDIVRSSITATNYILERTNLSRSNIMRILAAFRDTGKITLNRGILLSINNLLPEIP